MRDFSFLKDFSPHTHTHTHTHTQSKLQVRSECTCNVLWMYFIGI